MGTVHQLRIARARGVRRGITKAARPAQRMRRALLCCRAELIGSPVCIACGEQEAELCCLCVVKREAQQGAIAYAFMNL